MKSSKDIPTEKIKVTGEDLMGTSNARMPLLSGTRQNTAIDLLLLSHTAQDDRTEMPLPPGRRFLCDKNGRRSEETTVK